MIDGYQFIVAYDTRGEAEYHIAVAPRNMPVDLPAGFEIRRHGPDRWAVWMKWK